MIRDAHHHQLLAVVGIGDATVFFGFVVFWEGRGHRPCHCWLLALCHFRGCGDARATYGCLLFVMLWGDFIHARSNALATGVTFSVHMPLSYWPSWAYLGWRSSHAIYLIFTRRSIDLGVNEGVDGCMRGSGSGMREARPGGMTGCERMRRDGWFLVWWMGMDVWMGWVVWSGRGMNVYFRSECLWIDWESGGDL